MKPICKSQGKGIFLFKGKDIVGNTITFHSIFFFRFERYFGLEERRKTEKGN